MVYFQAPTSHHVKEFNQNYSSRYYKKEGNKYTFYVCGKKHRSEFRFKKLFVFPSFTSMRAKVKLIPLGAEKFTFMQIHTYKGINKPLLRLALYKGKIKAFIRTDSGVKKVVFKDYDGGWMDVEVKIKGNDLIIRVDDKTFKTDVSYWKYKDYFKLGVYLQSNGCARAVFKNIEVKE
ncbi:MAG: polysaccharide lyase family 7 protein [Epsilonproteobacteria bacterium]|nr:polysaccharide lyase family 7 protein [Campylobacterota bacterium]